MTGYERGRSIRIQNAQAVVLGLIAKYEISSKSPKREIRERFTQPDLDAYKEALSVLNGEGAID